jgi:hypothetical protein
MSESVTLWDRDHLHIWAEITNGSRLRIAGQDLRPPPAMGGEYEYFLTVEPEDIPRVVAALGGAKGDDVLPLLEANGEMIYHAGEQTWLKSLGIEPGFFSNSSMD